MTAGSPDSDVTLSTKACHWCAAAGEIKSPRSTLREIAANSRTRVLIHASAWADIETLRSERDARMGSANLFTSTRPFFST